MVVEVAYRESIPCAGHANGASDLDRPLWAAPYL